MSELGTGLCIISWLLLGGFAFAYHGQECQKKELGFLGLGCILLGPFAAGSALGLIWIEKKKK